MNSEELEQLRVRTRRFIREEVVPNEPSPGERLSSDVLTRLQDAAKAAGVFAPQVPKQYGGWGVPLASWSVIFQEAGYSPIGPSVLNCMAPDEGNMRMLELIATPDQLERYLRPVAEGRGRSCFAMTEPHPGAGSDPDALITTATPADGGWRIDGRKRFISGADGAAYAIVMARTPEFGGAPAGATMFLVDADNPGMVVGEQIHTIDRTIAGGHPYVTFEDCRVSADAVLGEVGRGFAYAQVRLGPARLTHCMRWLGLARRAHDTALDRAASRELFGSRLDQLGIAQDLLAQNVIDLETSDAIITRTALLLESDPKAGSALSSVAKVHCSDAIYRVIDRAIQLTGGDGVSDALPLAQFLNEVRPFRIYDGSNETHKWAIARRSASARAKQRTAGEPRLDIVRGEQ